MGELSVGLGRVEQHYEHLLNESSTEISELESSIELKYQAISKMQEESLHCLPEDERSEVEADLECPVCYELSRPPIYQCPEGHIICSACKPLLKACPQCDTKYTDPPIRCRFAEKLSAKFFKEEPHEQ